VGKSGSLRRICVITGSRAEYGHLYWLMRAMQNDRALKLQVVVTGMHLSRKFGLTYKIIEKEGFPVEKKVDILRFENTDRGIAKAVGLGCGLFADALKDLKPDIVVVCGDRYEIFASAIAAHILGIPIAHLHGGERSEGAIDEAIRHSITKMAHLHFAATEEYRRRIIQLGENPVRVFNFGAPGLDNLYKLKLMDRNQLEEFLGCSLNEKTAMVTYHPVTLEKEPPARQVQVLMNALLTLNIQAVCTKANADAGGERINRELEHYAKRYPGKVKLFDNLGQRGYLSCLKHLDMMIGNSSSGIVEASSFCLPVVNIGNRQQGRVRSRNVIDTPHEAAKIYKAIVKAQSPAFRKSLSGMRNPYERYRDRCVAERIKQKLKSVRLDNQILKKEFFDIKFKPGR